MISFIRSDHYALQSVVIADTLAVQIGDTLAKITSGGDTGKYGPFALNATDGRQTVANVIGPSTMRVSAVDSTGIQERVLPNQDGRLCTYVIHCAACDANQGFYYDVNGVRQTLNAEAGLTTKNLLAGKGFSFIN